MSPDFWVRLRPERGWSFSPEAPAAAERATVLAYRCAFCSKTFRLALSH